MTPRDLPPGSIIRLSSGRLAVPLSLVYTWPRAVQDTLKQFEQDMACGLVLLPAHWQMPIGRIEHVQPLPSRAPEDHDAPAADPSLP